MRIHSLSYVLTCPRSERVDPRQRRSTRPPAALRLGSQGGGEFPPGHTPGHGLVVGGTAPFPFASIRSETWVRLTMSISVPDLQGHFVAIRNNRLFEAFVIAVIILSALVIGAKTYDIDLRYRTALAVFDEAVTLFFLAEIAVRMAAEGSVWRFFRHGWNVFDFVIVTVSLIPVDQSEMAFLARLLRIFRVLRLVSVIPELRVLLDALLRAIPRLGYVSLLMFVIFYIYAAIGSVLFGTINQNLWGNISVALLTLFRVVTFEDWTDVMYETMEVYPLSWMYYVSFIFLAAFVFLNMMIGIVLEVLQKEHEKFEREHGEGKAGEVHWLRVHAQGLEDRLQRIESMLEELHERRRPRSG
jgi:voltage-gated sodium channel